MLFRAFMPIEYSEAVWSTRDLGSPQLSLLSSGSHIMSCHSSFMVWVTRDAPTPRVQLRSCEEEFELIMPLNYVVMIVCHFDRFTRTKDSAQRESPAISLNLKTFKHGKIEMVLFVPISFIRK
jgi:hypothetical protein